MQENSEDIVLFDDEDHLHPPATLGANHRVGLIDLVKDVGPPLLESLRDREKRHRDRSRQANGITPHRCGVARPVRL